jgi:hypothetical protein
LKWVGLCFHLRHSITAEKDLGGIKMSRRYQRTQEGNGIEQIQNMLLAPALAFGAWNPFLAAALKGNAQTHEGFGTIASEWQRFVAHRLQEDMALMQRLMRCCSPDQILAAYTDFWHRAAEDYGKEIIK